MTPTAKTPTHQQREDLFHEAPGLPQPCVQARGLELTREVQAGQQCHTTAITRPVSATSSPLRWGSAAMAAVSSVAAVSFQASQVSVRASVMLSRPFQAAAREHERAGSAGILARYGLPSQPKPSRTLTMAPVFGPVSRHFPGRGNARRQRAEFQRAGEQHREQGTAAGRSRPTHVTVFGEQSIVLASWLASSRQKRRAISRPMPTPKKMHRITRARTRTQARGCCPCKRGRGCCRPVAEEEERDRRGRGPRPSGRSRRKSGTSCTNTPRAAGCQPAAGPPGNETRGRSVAGPASA